MTPRFPPILPFLAAAAVAAVALSYCAPAAAQTTDTMTASADGVSVIIHQKDAGSCPEPFKRAQFFPKSGKPVEGCWTLVQRVSDGARFVRVDWSDGDQDHIPLAEFVKPQGGV